MADKYPKLSGRGSQTSVTRTLSGTLFAMARRPRQDLDDIDRRLCKLLVQDARTSVRELAARVGVTNETVTARLRRLRELNVLATTVVIDSETAGYRAGSVVRIKAPKRAVDILTDRFSASPYTQFLAMTIGACDLVVALLGVDLAAVRDTLRSAVRGVDNVNVLAVDTVSGAIAWDLNALTLPIKPWSPELLPAPEPPLDDLDLAVIEQFAMAGHESNREIARRLSVSDATVRARIRRLEQSGLIRVVTGVDPVAAGDRQLFAMAFVALDDDLVLSPLVESSIATTAVRTVGTADVVLQMGGRSVRELSESVTQLTGFAGVRDVAVAYLTDVVLHQNHLARFTS